MIEKTYESVTAGLRFHAIKTDKFKMSRLSFNFILPADAERSPRIRLMLATMMRGCEKYPTIVDINKRLDDLYGATATWRTASVGGRHVFRISSEFLSDRFRFNEDEESIALSVCKVIFEILFNPLKDENGMLSEKHFESERKLTVDSIRSLINNQKAYAAEKCARLMLEGAPAGISTKGTVEQVEAITLSEISENIEYFLKKSVIECYYVGNDDVGEIIKLIESKFAPLKRENPQLSDSEIALWREKDAEIRTLEEKMNVSQGRLNIGLTCDTVMRDEGYGAMVVFNEIFGGSSVSKLFMNVREKQSLCYYCYSSYSSATGTISIGCGIKSENCEKAYAEIENQLREMQQGHFDEKEIETAKKTIISGIVQVSDSPSAMTAFKFRRFLSGVNDTTETATAKIDRVTREEIIEAAKKVRFDTVYFLCGNGEEEECDDE